MTTAQKIIAAIERLKKPAKIAQVSEKGGVGKTSVAAGIIAVAAKAGLRTVGADMDPRATLTKELGVDNPEYSINDLLYVDPDNPSDPAALVRDALLPSGPNWPENVRVLASERALGRRELDPTPGMELRFRRALEGLDGEVDLVVIDSPPRPGGKLMGAVMIAADRLSIPATLQEDGFDGAVELLKSLQHYTTPGGLNPDLFLAEVVLSNVPRLRDIRDVHRHHEKMLREEFGDRILGASDGPDGSVIRSYAIREECRTACAPITSAPGREAGYLVSAYELSLLRALTAEKRAA